MKVILPSNGLLGTKWLDLREPKFCDLRKTITATSDEYLFKYEFVSGLCEFDPKKITMDDVQYLYEIAASAISFNTLKFKVRCSECDTEISSEFSFADDDIPVKTLHKDSRKCKKKVGDEEYVFHILSAQDGVDIHTYGLDDDEQDRMVEEATVCKVLGYDITDENIEKVRALPVAIYVACFLFVKANRHGMVITKAVKCPKCKTEARVRLELDSSWVKIDLPTFVAQYAQIRDCVDFKSFLDFTIPEFKNFIDYLNAEAKKDE
jgi:hypothetical protein